ncbi:hypothetical protein HA402_005235 [Bradysia odoriphaga]|nr:hypothetical protein HA402_005235 [Bradysia odoriphaga]
MWHYLFPVFIFAISQAVFASVINTQKFECPTGNGSFPHPTQCDKYYDCKEGIAEEVLCSDGLVFNQNLTRAGKCDQIFNVDCGVRTILQTPAPTSEYCLRRNGVFPHPDDTICDIFFICDDGEHSETKCANGLHFQASTGQCTWPNVVNRKNCVDQKRKLVDGFVCPDGPNKDKSGQVIVNPHYPHPTDCEYFYVCVDTVEPRKLRCDDMQVFNEEKKTCDAPANVPGCEDWFSGDDEK